MSRCSAAQMNLSTGRSSLSKERLEEGLLYAGWPVLSCVAVDVPPQKMQMAVLALSNAGTAMAAIYLCRLVVIVTRSV